ncbi:MAG: DUF1874 domain-containing protein [Alphaproteobacteria bacterium]|nr:DUF1874 domain-containing protein [Alphaproteobacteria bacterium]
MESFVLPALLSFGLVPAEGVRFHGFVTPELLAGPHEQLAQRVRAVAGQDTMESVRRTWGLDGYLLARSQDGLWSVVDRILSEVEDGDEVYLEITQGLRHVQVAILLAGGLLVALRPRVSVRLATYADLGAVDDPDAPEEMMNQLGSPCPRVSPIVNVTPLLDMFRWAAASTALRRSLDTRPISELLEGVGRHLAPLAPADAVAGAELDAANALRNVGPALALGWPRDIGRALADAAQTLAAIREADHSPLELAGMVTAKHAVRAALVDLGPLFGLRTKPDVLDEERLRFEARLVRALDDADRTSDALGILRELLVNMQLAADEDTTWLDLRSRGRAEARLRSAIASERPTRKALGKLWARVTDARNQLAHAGARQHLSKPAKLARVLRDAVAEVERLLERGDWRADFVVDEQAIAALWLVNAFSLNMLAEPLTTRAIIEPVSLETARELAADAVSAVGHDDTAQMFTGLLGRTVEVDRVSVAARSGDRLLVGQYRGPRLPVGATELPDGAEIHWFMVTIEQRPR